MPKTVWMVFLLVVFGTLACDQLSKRAAVEQLRSARSRHLLGGVVELTYAENKGALLGLGDRLGTRSRFWLLTIGGFGLLVILSLTLFARGVHSRFEVTGWGLLLGGGLGNLLDRVARDGAVVDFVRLSLGSLSTAIFNLADVAIVAGVLALMLAPAKRQAPDGDNPDRSRPLVEPRAEIQDGEPVAAEDSEFSSSSSPRLGVNDSDWKSPDDGSGAS